MADAEAKAKAEKLAAAKKRVEQLKKKNAKKGANKAAGQPPAASPIDNAKEEAKAATDDDDKGADSAEGHEDADEGAKMPEEAAAAEATEAEEPSIETTKTRARQASLSVQSKIRSSSFRQGAPMSPPVGSDAEETASAPEIYRKQAAKIEELEKENKRLAKEAGDAEKRWKKAEEELEDLRESDSGRPASAIPSSSSGEVANLKAEILALQRQNQQLQAQTSKTSRHGPTPSVSHGSLPSEDLTAQLASKSSTIESMEIEISNLRAQLDRTATGSSAEKEQITALEEKLSRTQKALDTSQRELQDVKKNLEHTTAKAVKEGSERTSAETKLRTLSREAEEAKAHADQLQQKVEALEKKVTTLTTLHKENDARSQGLKKEKAKADKELADLRSKVGSLENDISRLREERERTKKREAEGVDDDGVDELESEERQRLEQKVRQLEAEVFELRRGVWKDRRKEIDGAEG